MRSSTRAMAVVAAGLAAFASAASADWLVLRDGSKVETKGGWQTRGRLIVFERLGGGLASVRADEVDLVKSDEVTATAKLPPPAAAPVTAAPVRASVLVLTLVIR